MSVRIGIAGIITVGIMFLSFYLSDYIRPFFDPRYLLLIIVLILGVIMLALGVSIIASQSIGDNILDIIFDFEYSSIFFILFGLFLLIIAFLGLINGPDSIGMERF